jgi:hypothetical protein
MWQEWTSCSVTCGIGYQIRVRQCENEHVTNDGVTRTCDQSGSELHNMETRGCLLAGSHPYCTCKFCC